MAALFLFKTEAKTKSTAFVNNFWKGAAVYSKYYAPDNETLKIAFNCLYLVMQAHDILGYQSKYHH